MRQPQYFRAFFGFFLLLIFSLDPASAGTTWNNPVSNDWFTATNWTSGVPNSTTDATINFFATFQPLIAGTGQVQNLTLNAGSSVTVGDGSGLQVFANGGTANITNNGSLSLASSGNSTLFDVVGNVTLGGTGNIT